MNKTAIKNFAIWARNKLIADINYKAGLLGITDTEIKNPLPQFTPTVQFFDIGTKEPYSISGVEIEQRKKLVEEIQRKAKHSDYNTAYKSVVEEVAYTWFNRLIAIRFMEVNNYLPTRIRVMSSESSNKTEPDLVTHPMEANLEYTAYEKDRIMQLKNDNKLDELFRMLFIKQCNALNAILPELFEKTNDYTELLLNVSFTDQDGVIYHLVNDISEDNFNVSKAGQVEIIGWMYQYYNTEPKDETFALLKKNVKITKERIPAATQLFTPDWIVRYMVENSLGRLWLESHPNIALKANWKYYLDEAEQTPEVAEKLRALRSQSPVKSPEDICLIDPCMGSGHILVYAFDVLIQIYESEGYNPREAAKLILEKNLYGLDIDRRAYQLAYFSLMMKARQYNRRIFAEDIKPQVYHPAGFPDGEEYGSLVKVDTLPPKPVEKSGQLSIEDTFYGLQLNAWNFKRLLVQKYDVVVTNPPYMGVNGMAGKLSDFIKKNYPDSKSDFSTAFMEQTLYLCKLTGFMAMINIPSWMFLTSYENLRKRLIANNMITAMLHFGRGVFGPDFGTTCFVIGKTNVQSYRATYKRLFEKPGNVDSIEQKEKWFFEGKGNHFSTSANYEKIPGYPIAYWVSENLLKVYNSCRFISDIAEPKQGIATTDNDHFLRLWYEVEFSKTGLYLTAEQQAVSGKKWFPYNKGGAFKKWYGNNDYLVNWENDGFEMRNHPSAVIRNLEYHFKECITWSLTNISYFGARYRPIGSLFDTNGMALFSADNDRMYLLGFLCCKISSELMKITNPTLASQVGDIARLPIIMDYAKKANIDSLVKQCVNLTRLEFDSFETSWDFKRHPLLSGERTVAVAFAKWERESAKRFATLKANEEKLNQVFIDIYGLQDELTSEIEEKDVTICKAELRSDICRFISYVVGCMFGRYSLDVDGLAYAGGQWDNLKYSTFLPDKDNILPITDEEYFGDDVIGLLCAFLKKTFGKETLEENLDFIAKALGNKGNSSREIIRNYFLKDFFKDHCKVYQKRPIYWLFNSGKADGFKALVYMHRYDENTIGNLRIDYLHRMQRIYENEISRMQETIENSKDAREVTAATKRIEKLLKQLKETKEYDEKIAHLALARITIDLDDGVKVNYEKVQTDTHGKKLEVLAKI